MEIQRTRKRLLILGATLSLVAFVVVGVFLLLGPKTEEDHLLVAYESEEDVQQASQQGIDAVSVLGEYLFEVAGTRSAAVLLNNPNESWHALDLSYRFTLYREGEEPRVREGDTRILAASKRLIIEEFEGVRFDRVEFSIERIDWAGAEHSVAPHLRVRKGVFETAVGKEGPLMRVSGELVNESSSGVGGIELGVLLFDAQGVVRAAVLAERPNLGVGESAPFEITSRQPTDASLSDMSFIIASEAVRR